jgi:hypothetical protein
MRKLVAAVTARALKAEGIDSDSHHYPREECHER